MAWRLRPTRAAAGTRGKTTCAWFLRGILEEFGLLSGMVGSVEHALSHDRLTEQGALWTPSEPDPTQDLCARHPPLLPMPGAA